MDRWAGTMCVDYIMAVFKFDKFHTKLWKNTNNLAMPFVCFFGADLGSRFKRGQQRQILVKNLQK